MKKLALIFLLFSCPAYAVTPLINCNGNQFLQSNASSQTYLCTTPSNNLLSTRFIYAPTITDTATSTDAMIQWQSGMNLAKTETIPAGTTNGQILAINDGAGTAANYPVTLSPVDGVTVGGTTTLALNNNFFTIYLSWDGVSNWVVVAYDNGAQSTTGPSFAMTDSFNIATKNNGNLLTLECNPCAKSSGR